MREHGQKRWSVMLGFALGGFFDGILLHQILQWHHLLSLVPGLTDLRTQVLWDGYFHGVMYLVAAVALWGLWRTGTSDTRNGAGAFGPLLIGFGTWHVVDAVISHWVLGIHRIRVDSPQPLLWDLLWVTAFGLMPWLLAWRMLAGPNPSSMIRPRMMIVLLGLLTVAAAAWSLMPPAGQRYTTVVFRSDTTPAAVFAAIETAHGRLAWSDAAMSVIIVDVAPGHAWTFYRRGALLVSGSGSPAGCAGWSRI